MTYANSYTLEVPIMEFNQQELEHLLNCLNYYYNMNSDQKAYMIDINCQLCRKIDEQLQLTRRAF